MTLEPSRFLECMGVRGQVKVGEREGVIALYLHTTVVEMCAAI